MGRRVLGVALGRVLPRLLAAERGRVEVTPGAAEGLVAASDDGTRAFFTSAEQLVTGDTDSVTDLAIAVAAAGGPLAVAAAKAVRFGGGEQFNLSATVKVDSTTLVPVAGGLVVNAALWWELYHRSADALAPDSYMSRRHAGPIIVEADGKVIGRQDEDETDFSLLLADAPKSGAATAKH